MLRISPLFISVAAVEYERFGSEFRRFLWLINSLKHISYCLIFYKNISENMSEKRLSLSFKNLFGYLEASATSRCIIEGEAVVNAQHIITRGTLEKTATSVTMFALCLKTSALTEKPHEIKIRMSTAKELCVLEAVCSCKAGNSGRCKHIAANLILCTRDDILRLPPISSTDLECYWKKSTAVEMYKAIPLREILHSDAEPKLKPVINIDYDKIVRRLTDALPHSALAKHIIGRRSQIQADPIEDASIDQFLPIILQKAEQSILKTVAPLEPTGSCCKETYMELCNINVAEIARSTKSDQSMWHKERQFRITGSRCYSLYTYSLNDWETKAKKYFWPKSFKNKYTEHGIQCEGAARNTYKTKNGYQVEETGLLVSIHHPWLAYSPDGIVFKNNQPIKLLEIKCPYEGKTKTAIHLIESCKYLHFDENNFLRLKRKHTYFAQVQLGMGILNLAECDFVLYSSFDNTFINIITKFDELYFLSLIEKLKGNFNNHMLHVICENNIK